MSSSELNISARLMAMRESEGSFPARSAIASFLFMVMPIDGQTHPKELERLSRILADDFSLSKAETEALVGHVREQKITGEGMVALAEILKAEFDEAELLTLISHMWEMVFADGKMHETEILLVERVADLLDISQEDVAKAMTLE